MQESVDKEATQPENQASVKSVGEIRSPWYYIPHLSFMQGIPIIIIAQVTAIIYKSLGFSNKVIGLLSLLTLPMSLKFFFGPIIDRYSTKRKWLLFFQIGLFVCFIALSAVMYFDISFFVVSIILLILLSTFTGFHDIAVDGFYVESLSADQRAFFIGIKTAFMRLAIIFTTGFLVMAAGKIGEAQDNIRFGWSVFFLVPAAMFVFSYFWHVIILPRHNYTKIQESKGSNFYLKAFKAYFTQEKAFWVISFILIYRAGEGLLARMAAPFLMDIREVGGLGVSVSSVGFMYGSVGMLFTIIGGVLGGVLLKRYGFKKMMVLLAVFMTLPNIFYIYLAYSLPAFTSVLDISFIPAIFGSDAAWTWDINLQAQIVIAIECLGYGMGYSAFLLFVCQIAAKVEYKASFFSISTGLSTLGWMLIGATSGYVQENFGYFWLFTLSIIFALPGILILIYLLHSIKDLEN